MTIETWVRISGLKKKNQGLNLSAVKKVSVSVQPAPLGFLLVLHFPLKQNSSKITPLDKLLQASGLVCVSVKKIYKLYSIDLCFHHVSNFLNQLFFLPVFCVLRLPRESLSTLSGCWTLTRENCPSQPLRSATRLGTKSHLALVSSGSG